MNTTSQISNSLILSSPFLLTAVLPLRNNVIKNKTPFFVSQDSLLFFLFFFSDVRRIHFSIHQTGKKNFSPQKKISSFSIVLHFGCLLFVFVFFCCLVWFGFFFFFFFFIFADFRFLFFFFLPSDTTHRVSSILQPRIREQV